MSTFLELCLDGKARPEDIDDFVSQWHDAETEKSVSSYLGLTKAEYALWMRNSDSIHIIVESAPMNRKFAEAWAGFQTEAFGVVGEEFVGEEDGSSLDLLHNKLCLVSRACRLGRPSPHLGTIYGNPLAVAWQVFQEECYKTAVEKGWWEDPRSSGTLIALMHSELSEALEGLRKGNPDSEKFGISSLEEELADVLIRMGDFCEHKGYDIGDYLCEFLKDPGSLGRGIEETIALTVGYLAAFAEYKKMNLGSSTAAKALYNRGRSYRHGGKKF